MHRAGDQTDEPVLLAATSFPLSPRAFYILYSLLEEGRNAPRPPTPCPAFLPSLRAIMPHLLFSGPIRKSGKNTISFRNTIAAVFVFIFVFLFYFSGSEDDVQGYRAAAGTHAGAKRFRAAAYCDPGCFHAPLTCPILIARHQLGRREERE